jgi:phosphatidylserine/phosphatidylglycerophosphate/cardiolipin synthase-like enzyme
MVVDGQVAVVGSANGDKQSGDHSQEVNAFIDSAAFAKQIDAQVWSRVWGNGISAQPQ